VGLIFDSTEFIHAERRRLTVQSILEPFRMTEGVAVSVMTLAELKHGVRRADSPLRSMVRQRFLDEVIATFTPLPISESIAIRSGELEAELELRGEKLDIADILIAATAIEYDLEIVTRNINHFKRIPGLRIRP
jgi:predicted nucleic acid-binding protein